MVSHWGSVSVYHLLSDSWSEFACIIIPESKPQHAHNRIQECHRVLIPIQMCIGIGNWVTVLNVPQQNSKHGTKYEVVLSAHCCRWSIRIVTKYIICKIGATKNLTCHKNEINFTNGRAVGLQCARLCMCAPAWFHNFILFTLTRAAASD